MRKIELLSPAKDIECGMAAINHGADAIYIGAQKFGARAAAGNSTSDIEKLAKYAHKYNTNVYVTVNTILKDSEIESARRLITELYEAGADALIVQDYSILKMDIPPIALHSSTQIDTRDKEKAMFLEKAGFSQIVVARELPLDKIREIHESVNVPIEAFIHGALCVSYSGQCYLSQAIAGRSANRGECSQPCRMAYTLTDADGRTIIKDKYLLSLKDMDRSRSIKEMIEAGVSSFKIEGRLKSASYVKNVTAYYRQIFDEILEGNDTWSKSSAGKVYLNFTPDPSKSFRRGSTEYLLHGDKENIASPMTQKSTGEELGIVTYIGRNHFEVKTDKQINNGDGLCFFNENGELIGLRANTVEVNKIFLDNSIENIRTLRMLKKGMKVNRNSDRAFEKTLSQDNSAARKISVDVRIKDCDGGITIEAECEDGVKAQTSITGDFEPARNAQMALDNLKANISKTGDTIYEVSGVDIDIDEPKFIPNSIIAEKRRELTNALDDARTASHKRETRRAEMPGCTYPYAKIGYEGNVNNQLAKAFLEEHGATDVEDSFELKARKNVPLMTCRHCIKRIAGLCAKNGYQADYSLKHHIKAAAQEPLYIHNDTGTRLRLEFDCKKCEMTIYKD